MPYIKPERRKAIMGNGGAYVDVREINLIGELNFAITMLCKDYLEKHGKSYNTINSIIGALECSKQEFYRKLASPYEEEKEMENGSIF